MNGPLPQGMTAAIAVVPVILLLPLLSLAGLSTIAVQIVGVVAFTIALTIHDVVRRGSGGESGGFVRSRITTNLVLVSLCAVVVSVVVPGPATIGKDTGAAASKEVGRVAPPAEDARTR